MPSLCMTGLRIRELPMIFPPHLVFLLPPLLAFAAAIPSDNTRCGTTGNFTANGTYEANLRTLLGNVVLAAGGEQSFFSRSVGRSPYAVNAIGLCRGNVGAADCWTCMRDSAAEIASECPLQKEAAIWYDNCTLRYSNRTIFGALEDSIVFTMWRTRNSTRNIDQFNQVFRNLTEGLRDRAANGDSTRKFAIGNATDPSFKTLFGLVQCTPDLSSLQCDKCLSRAIENVPECCNEGEGATVASLSCSIRYDVYPFFDSLAYLQPPSPSPLPAPQSPVPSPTKNPPAEGPQSPVPSPTKNPPAEGNDNNSGHIALVITMSAVGLSLLIAGIVYICLRSRRLKKNLETVPVEEIRNAECPQYDLNTIRAATDDFSDANKLGQGGFGTVYKGTLASGQVIAVKRLSVGMGQGDQEFKNEVLLVGRLQHRNLVRLLGFCPEGGERLLIYEFEPNSSLDNFIFDPVRNRQLTWERRQMIIRGIARGLLYLHEDSRLRIIHRDLKADNILLDADMNPKISDFGTARLFVVDQSQDATSRVVGTFGYMAPEYLTHGLYSVKSDVFSFGVLLLEIISGQKCSRFRIGDTTEDLRGYAWRNWREGTPSNLTDPNLTGGSRTEIVRCIHVGLLCVQDIEADRPTMGSVVSMLNSSSSLPPPSRPAFVLHRSPESDTAFRVMATHSNQSESRVIHESVNEASITELYPR